jgi:hypothetical protein
VAAPINHALIAACSPWSLVRCPGRSHPLLFPHVRERQPCADRNYIKNGMRWVGRQTQLVDFLPGANTHIRRIELGTLPGQFLASLFRALVFFMLEALGGSPDEVGCMRRHRSLEHESRY